MPRGERGTAKPFQFKGCAVWYIKYYVPGEKMPRVESSKSTNKTVAVRLLNQRRAEVDRGTVVAAEPLIDHLLELYIGDQTKHNRAGLRNATNYVDRHLRPAFGQVRASKLTDALINRFVTAKRTAGLADGTINRILAALKRSYALGMEVKPQLVFAQPRIELLEENNVREGFLEYEEYVALRNELPDHQRLILVIGFHLGMRRGEILNLRWDQVDWRANMIRLEKWQTKAKQARVAPLYGELRAWLDMAFAAREGDCPFIISWKGDGITEVKTAWNKARIRAGIPEIHIHDLRRTAARNMIRAGVPEKQVMLIVGWKTRAMLDRYNIVDERDIQIAGDKMETYLAAMREASGAAKQIGRKVGRTADDVNPDTIANSWTLQ